MSFIKGLTITGFTTIIVTAVALFNNIIVTRQIGAEGRGKYVVVANIIMILSLILGEGIRRANTLLISKDRSYLSKLVAQTLVYALVITLLFLVIFYFDSLWKTIIPNITNKLFLLALLSTVAIILWRAFQAIYLGFERILEFNLLQIISTVSVFVINFIGIVFFDFDLTSIIISIFVAAMLTMIVSFIRLKVKISAKDFSLTFFKRESSKLSVKSTISAIEVYLTLKGNIFLINYFLNPVQAGIFSIALVFTELLQKLPNIAGPLIISRIANDQTKNSDIMIARLFRIVLAFDIAIAVILYLIGKELIVFLFKAEFEASYYILLYLMPAIILYGPGTIIHAYFMGKGFPLKSIYINGIVGVVNIAANIILIPLYGIIATAIISSVTYSLWTVLYIFYFHKESAISFKNIVIINRSDFIDIFKSLMLLIKRK